MSEKDGYTIARNWSLHATVTEIAVEHVRMAAVTAGDEDPGFQGAALEQATKFYGPSVIAHLLNLLREQGMSVNECMSAAFREYRELKD